MHQPDVYQSVVDFLDLFDTTFTHEADAVKALEITLDQLALALHFINYTFEPNWPDPPQQDYTVFRDKARQRFPSFGLYNTPASITEQIAVTTINVGDAIDDIADIACELNIARWCWRNTSPNDALWHLEFGRNSHFGWHIRELQQYIEACKNQL